MCTCLRRRHCRRTPGTQPDEDPPLMPVQREEVRAAEARSAHVSEVVRRVDEAPLQLTDACHRAVGAAQRNT